MRTILNIGGDGFIGYELTKLHLELGDRVVVVDNCSNSLGFYPELMTLYPNYIFIKGDIENLSNIDFPCYGFDVIYHLASESRPNMFHEKCYDIVSSNIQGIQEIMLLIDKHGSIGKTKIVFASTSEVYGYNDSVLCEDDDLMVNPKYQRNCYSLSKILVENILQNKLDYKWNIVRFFNTYGSVFRDDDTKIIPALKRSVVTGEPFNLYGDGNQTRSFTHISDLINGLVVLSSSDNNHEVFNLGNRSPIKMNDLIGIVRKYHPELKVVDGGEREGEPYFREPNSDKAYELLGWFPIVSLEEGIREIFS